MNFLTDTGHLVLLG